MCVCVCVHQLLACSHVNLSPVQARITKFGPEKQITLVNIFIVCFFVCFVVVVVFVVFWGVIDLEFQGQIKLQTQN